MRNVSVRLRAFCFFVLLSFVFLCLSGSLVCLCWEEHLLHRADVLMGVLCHIAHLPLRPFLETSVVCILTPSTKTNGAKGICKYKRNVSLKNPRSQKNKQPATHDCIWYVITHATYAEIGFLKGMKANKSRASRP